MPLLQMDPCAIVSTTRSHEKNIGLYMDHYDAVQGVKQHEGDEERAFAETEKAGVKIISSAEVLRS